jgi:hypothetical protein
MQGLREGLSAAGGGRLDAVLKLNLAVLAGLLVLAFLLPLSGPERLFVGISAAVLMGVNWALVGLAAGRSGSGGEG